MGHWTNDGSLLAKQKLLGNVSQKGGAESTANHPIRSRGLTSMLANFNTPRCILQIQDNYCKRVNTISLLYFYFQICILKRKLFVKPNVKLIPLIFCVYKVFFCFFFFVNCKRFTTHAKERAKIVWRSLSLIKIYFFINYICLH